MGSRLGPRELVHQIPSRIGIHPWSMARVFNRLLCLRSVLDRRDMDCSLVSFRSHWQRGTGN